MNIQASFSRPGKPLMSERRVSILGAVLVAIGPISMALFTPAMPEIVRAFGSTEHAVKMTLTLYFAGFAFAQLICGPLSDGLGRRPVTLAFIGIYCVASGLALMAPNVETLIAARFLQGVGAAVGVAIARAIVRDLFTRDQSARIMNLIGLILGIGPAFSPTLGGITMELFGWHSIFLLMFAAGLGIAITAYLCLRETVVRDLSRIRPKALLKSYRTLLRSRYFMTSALVVGGTVGTAYTQATVLPFILIQKVGLTPSQFGLGMLMQSGFFFLGNITVRAVMRRTGAAILVPVGLGFVFIGATSLAILLHLYEPTFLRVMGPVAFSSFGMAFVMPAMTTASLAPFPHIAGAASAMAGFVQMGAGLVGGMVIAAFVDPAIGMGTVVPIMGYIAIAAWIVFSRLPEPALANVKTAVPSDMPPA